MKIIGTLTILFFLLIGIGCQPEPKPEPESKRTSNKPQTPSEAAIWQEFKVVIKDLGYDLLDVTKSQKWIEKNRDKIEIPDKIIFGSPHIVKELPYLKYGIMITIDHNKKHRVFAREWPPPWPPPGFMTEKASIDWLETEGYTVEKNQDGYTLSKISIYNSQGIKVNSAQTTKIRWGSTIVFDTNVTIRTESGYGLAIKVN